MTAGSLKEGPEGLKGNWESIHSNILGVALTHRIKATA